MDGSPTSERGRVAGDGPTAGIETGVAGGERDRTTDSALGIDHPCESR
jgi:hypothetical protein